MSEMKIILHEPLAPGVECGLRDEIDVHLPRQLQHAVELGFGGGVEGLVQAAGGGEPGQGGLGRKFIGRSPRVVAGGGGGQQRAADGLEE